MSYDHKEIEQKWQRHWIENGTFEPDMKKAKKPFYNLMMFPYPSAEGLHVGNMYAFTGADIFGRFKRLQGFDVFEPMGLDGFGIHSENYALKVGGHPKKIASETQERFYKQLHATGNGFAWNHKLETYDPAFYKWTQWLFTELYRAGLAYRKEAPVNFCPSCKTVLADEQVIHGECERCGTEVETRFLKQWFFRITDYAEKLLNNLPDLDWSEKVKIAQERWIGRSEGAEIEFTVKDAEQTITVFTTRPDTLFGATYVVLSPYHNLIHSDELRLSENARNYVQKNAKRTTADAEKEKEGIFSGLYAINPATQQEIPIWISDYVLAGYGTGAVMAVPAHDGRDHEFATKYELLIREVIQKPTDADDVYTGEGELINSGEFDGQQSEEARATMAKKFGRQAVSWHLRDWLISRQRYWGPPIPITYCRTCWENAKTKNQKSKLKLGIDYDVIDNVEHAIVPVPEDQLPVELPDVGDFKPMGTGKSPLANHPEFYETECPECGGKAIRETDVSDTFLDSAWYFLRYPTPDLDDKPFDKATIKEWLPVDMYIGGAEHSVLHLLYARFVTHVLKDRKHIGFAEPFTTFRAHGLLIRDGAKMSKSKGNVVVPDEYIEKYGADVFRTYLMFLGPFTQGGDFRDSGITGVERFLRRVADLQARCVDADNTNLNSALHSTIKKVTEDTESLKFNTAIAVMMECVNAFEKEKEIGKAQYENLLVLLASFAPHLAEEMWQQCDNATSIFEATLPSYDEKELVADTITLVVQVNSKVRDQIEMKPGISQKEAETAARESEKVQKWIEGKKMKNVVFVQDKLINFVV